MNADFDNITLEKFPSKVPPFALIAKVWLDPTELGKHQVRIAVYGPDGLINDGKPGVEANVEAAKRAGSETSLSMVIQIALDFPQEGDYRFSLLIDDDEIASVPLHAGKS